MANVEHSTLTGSDLHESKGVAAAAANRVYVTDGLGSGAFSQVPAAAIATTGILVFQAQRFHIRDSVSSGTGGQGALSSGVWNTRRLGSALINEIGASAASNQITLPAGTYWAEGWVRFLCTPDFGAPGSFSGKAAVRLRNVSDSTTALTGSSWSSSGDAGTGAGFDFQQELQFKGQFTVVGTKALEIQNYVNNISSCPFTAGNPVSSGENECYAELVIWKIS